MIALSQAGPDANFAAILDLIRTSFAYMEARIEPPSSMHRLTLGSIRLHAAEQEIWVAASGQTLAGCVFFTRKPNSLYVGKLAIAAPFRKQGLARRMIDKAAERARAHSLEALELEVRIELTENREAFAAMGFRKIAKNAHPGFNRTTSITMQKAV